MNWDPYLWVGPCEDELAPSFVATLGNGPFCTWLNSTVYMVSMGAGATISQETQFFLNERSRIVYSERVKGRLLQSLPALTRVGVSVAGRVIQPILTALPPTLPQPVPELVGPSEINRCTKVFGDGSLSYGTGARPYSSVRWQLDLSQSRLRAGMLVARCVLGCCCLLLAACCLFLITCLLHMYYTLHTAYYILHAYDLLLTTHYSLFTTYSLLLTTHYLFLCPISHFLFPISHFPFLS